MACQAPKFDTSQVMKRPASALTGSPGKNLNSPGAEHSGRKQRGLAVGTPRLLFSSDVDQLNHHGSEQLNVLRCVRQRIVVFEDMNKIHRFHDLSCTVVYYDNPL